MLKGRSLCENPFAVRSAKAPPLQSAGLELTDSFGHILNERHHHRRHHNYHHGHPSLCWFAALFLQAFEGHSTRDLLTHWNASIPIGRDAERSGKGPHEVPELFVDTFDGPVPHNFLDLLKASSRVYHHGSSSIFFLTRILGESLQFPRHFSTYNPLGGIIPPDSSLLFHSATVACRNNGRSHPFPTILLVSASKATDLSWVTFFL